ncbi:MAG: fructose 1,6-bisphosphatase [Planctomycetes bacterium]|nr:fructose 1,6-bisphosphatase [Planctomycetota bacterium]
MKLTLSLIKADVGSIGGHTKPSDRMMDVVRDEVRAAISRGLLIDGTRRRFAESDHGLNQTRSLTVSPPSPPRPFGCNPRHQLC